VDEATVPSGQSHTTASNGIELFVVEPDPRLRASLVAELSALEYPVHGFWCAETFLSTLTADRGGCLITAAALPGLDGLGLLELVIGRAGRPITVVVLADADVATAVRAVRAGASDVLGRSERGRALKAAVLDALAPQLVVSQNRDPEPRQTP
jgi:FixJ family two-component response regulator